MNTITVDSWGLTISCERRFWLFMGVATINDAEHPVWGWIVADNKEMALTHVDAEFMASLKYWILIDVIEAVNDVRIQEQADMVISSYIDKKDKEK